MDFSIAQPPMTRLFFLSCRRRHTIWPRDWSSDVCSSDLILKLLEKDAGGQKDLSDPRVHSQVREAIFNRKDQTLKSAFSEVARNKATVVNYLAQRKIGRASCRESE